MGLGVIWKLNGKSCNARIPRPAPWTYSIIVQGHRKEMSASQSLYWARDLLNVGRKHVAHKILSSFCVITSKLQQLQHLSLTGTIRGFGGLFPDTQINDCRNVSRNCLVFPFIPSKLFLSVPRTDSSGHRSPFALRRPPAAAVRPARLARPVYRPRDAAGLLTPGVNRPIDSPHERPTNRRTSVGRWRRVNYALRSQLFFWLLC